MILNFNHLIYRGERNFHIFYYMYDGLVSETQKLKYHLSNDTKYRFKNKFFMLLSVHVDILFSKFIQDILMKLIVHLVFQIDQNFIRYIIVLRQLVLNRKRSTRSIVC